MSKGVYEASRLYAWRPAVFLIVRKLSLVFCCKHCSMETFLLTKNFSIFSSELGLNLGLALHNPPLCIFCYRDRFKDKQKFLINLLLVALLKQWDFGQGDVQRSLSASAILWFGEIFVDLMLGVSHSSCCWVLKTTVPEVNCPQAESHSFLRELPWVMCPETAHCPPRHLGESFPFLWMLFSKAFVLRSVLPMLMILSMLWSFWSLHSGEH